jgi:hypothetical protein
VRSADVRRGGVFRIIRADDGFLARWISGVAIYPCEGMRDPVSECALAAAFEGGGWERVTRLVRRDDVPVAECWLKGPVGVSHSASRGFLPRGLSNACPDTTACGAMPRLAGRHRTTLNELSHQA